MKTSKKAEVGYLFLFWNKKTKNNDIKITKNVSSKNNNNNKNNKNNNKVEKEGGINDRNKESQSPKISKQINKGKKRKEKKRKEKKRKEKKRKEKKRKEKEKKRNLSGVNI